MGAIKRFVGSLFGQVLVGLVAGIVVGFYWPGGSAYLKPLSDLFIRAIQMIISPLVLCIVVVGITRAGGGRQIGRLGAKSLVYFLVATVVALGLGLATGNIFRPGDGYGASLASLDLTNEQYARAAATAAEPVTTFGEAAQMIVRFLVDLMPNAAVQAFATNNILQVLIFSVLLGLALASMGERSRKLVEGIDALGHGLFRVVGFLMHLAPLAAFGSMVFAVGEFGVDSLVKLVGLVLCLYGASLVFLLGFLWPLARFGAGISLWKLMNYTREEIFITLGTISSAAVMPRLLEKMEKLGCEKPVVGFVLPAGYSFNLTGSAIYMTLAPLFIAQALGIEFGWQAQLTMFLLLIVTSKAMAGVAGSSLVVILTSLQATGVIPPEGLILILGVERIQNEVRSVLNLIGNCVATAVLARSENALDLDRARRVLNGEVDVESQLESGEDVAVEGLEERAEGRA